MKDFRQNVPCGDGGDSRCSGKEQGYIEFEQEIIEAMIQAMAIPRVKLQSGIMDKCEGCHWKALPFFVSEEACKSCLRTPAIKLTGGGGECTTE